MSVVVLGGDDVEQLGPPLLGLGLELGRDRHLVALLALVLVSSHTRAVIVTRSMTPR